MTTKGDNIKSAFADIYGVSVEDLNDIQKLTHEQKVEGLLQQVVDTQGSSDGGGGAVTIADGADIVSGSTADAAATPGGPGTNSAKLRLITTQLNSIAGFVDQLEGFTDGLETLIGTTNTSLSAISGYVDQLETYTDQLESLMTFSKGSGTTDANTLRTVIASDQYVPVSGSTLCVSAEFTRPADTTAYAVDDVVSNSTTTTTPLTFTNAARVGNGTGYIVSARMAKSTNTTTNASFRLWLYRDNPTTPPGDNSPFALLWANRTVRMGFIDFTLSTAGTGSNSASDFKVGLNIPFFAVNGRNLYGVLIARGAYTPASGEQFFIEIGLEQN